MNDQSHTNILHQTVNCTLTALTHLHSEGLWGHWGCVVGKSNMIRPRRGQHRLREGGTLLIQLKCLHHHFLSCPAQFSTSN